MTDTITDFKDLCINCSMRKGTERWVGDYDAITAARTGWHQMWCKRCVIVAQLERAKELAARIPELERQLAELDAPAVCATCGGSGRVPLDIDYLMTGLTILCSACHKFEKAKIVYCCDKHTKEPWPCIICIEEVKNR